MTTNAFDLSTVRMVNALPDLLTTALLQTVGLAINTTHRVYICCDAFCTPSGMPKHLTRYHKAANSPTLRCEIKAAAAHYNLVDTLPEWPISLDPVALVSGAPVRTDKDCCAGCGYMASDDVVKKHQAKSDCKGSQVIKKRPCQMLSGANHCKYIYVALPQVPLAAPIESHLLLDDLRSYDWHTVVSAKYPTAPQITPWLRRTRWHEYDLQAKAAEITAFLEYPTAKGNNGWVIDTVQNYFLKATQLIRTTPALVRQMLNTASPDEKGINRTPLEAFQNDETTRVRYAREIVSLIHVLLRPTNLFTIPMSPALHRALDRIRQDGVHEVFKALWMTEWKESPENQMPNPTMYFIMVQSLHKTGDFRTAKQTPHILTRIAWAIRMACLVEAHEIVDREEAADTTVSVYNVVVVVHRRSKG
ncbi:hypothetical protein C8F01DRAFT_1262751 [Mycena amicta]|nr:hypothetical protein C8F01DRAFT_1262751 [Mycena amicta]